MVFPGLLPLIFLPVSLLKQYWRVDESPDIVDYPNTPWDDKRQAMRVKINYPKSHDKQQMMLLVHCLNMGFGNKCLHDEANCSYLVDIEEQGGSIDLSYLSDYFTWIDIEMNASIE